MNTENLIDCYSIAYLFLVMLFYVTTPKNLMPGRADDVLVCIVCTVGIWAFVSRIRKNNINE